MTQTEFLFSGFGGQGVMFAGQLLAYAAMEANLEVTWYPSYGPEMRGGTAHCTVVISERPIGSPVVRHPRVGLLFNRPSFLRYEAEVATGGLIVLNSSLAQERSTRTDVRTAYIPALETAEQLGNGKLMNMVLLGAALALEPVFPVSVLEEALERHIPAHRRNLLGLNQEALAAGVNLALTQVPA
jgi:2-oxoglutarate ferredoxin oxidoreductase subunit gamma